MNSILEKRKNQIEKLKKYLLNDLSFLNVPCIKVFGSSVNEQLFDNVNSDIDIIAYTDKIQYYNISEIIDKVEKQGGNFLDKRPIFLKDFINARIEYFYEIDGVAFDINLFPNKVWGYENMADTVLHDALDIFFGGMNQYAETIYGNFQPLEEIKDDIYPFYNDKIREQRLIILENRINSIINKIKEKMEKNDIDVLEYIMKSRAYVVKWLFIYNKIYPIDIYKHLDYQLSNMLHLDRAEIDNILLTNSNSIYEIIDNYVNYVERKVLTKK